ncbi:unnamed protein product, partial [Lampetra fluviatilis]
MASTRRFQNPYPDYSGSLVPSCTREALLPVVAELVDRVVSHTSGAGGRGSGGGVYVGPAGAAYMLVRALDAGLEAPRDVSYLETAWRLGEAGLRGVERDPESRASFLLGGAGVYVVLAMVSLRMGQRERALEFASQYAALYEVCVQPRFLPCGSDELFVGRAGFLHGADYLSRELGVPVLTRDQIACLCSVMVTSGEEYARSTHSASPLMYAYYGTEYLGAAHGLCAVLLALLCHVEVLDGRQAALVWGAVDFLLQLQGPEGAAPGADNWAPRHGGGAAAGGRRGTGALVPRGAWSGPPVCASVCVFARATLPACVRARGGAGVAQGAAQEGSRRVPRRGRQRLPLPAAAPPHRGAETPLPRTEVCGVPVDPGVCVGGAHPGRAAQPVRGAGWHRLLPARPAQPGQRTLPPVRRLAL